MRGISWLADDLLASPEGLCSMELVSQIVKCITAAFKNTLKCGYCRGGTETVLNWRHRTDHRLCVEFVTLAPSPQWKHFLKTIQITEEKMDAISTECLWNIYTMQLTPHFFFSLLVHTSSFQLSNLYINNCYVLNFWDMKFTGHWN